ncbi:unnamed protein product [Eruca vesicaria subsp. sativa]|uniref:Band 7 domain-containing protein n=1 Tax=Eruca vesicaria subsp. sativa TaxID=29727 RepID=A0ABC8M4N0_ERUVS|nr:unnamed protein product [Eruca vesicaria subsp. sativa]
MFPSSLVHQVPEGHVGAYWRGGALRTSLQNQIHHEINQFCSSHSLQQVDIDNFDQIDGKMKEALQADFTRYAPGIEIIRVCVTKPKIPTRVRRMEEERSKVRSVIHDKEVGNCLQNWNLMVLNVFIAIEKQRVAENEADTKKLMAISEAENNTNVSKILMQQKLTEKDRLRREADIENQMYLDRQKSFTDADYYR